MARPDAALGAFLLTLLIAGFATAPVLADEPLGAVACATGDRDCNPCVNDIEGSFERMSGSARHPGRGAQWLLDWNARYGPSYSQPKDFIADWSPVARNHVQGFVRTHHPLYPYAGTYSHRRGNAGTVFLVSEGREGELALAKAVRTEETHHPSGLAALGSYLVTAIEDGVGLLDLDQLDHNRLYPLELPVSAQQAKGGLAMTRLADGSYLLVISMPTPGRTGVPGLSDYFDRPSRTLFFRVRGSLSEGGERAVEQVGEWKYVQPRAWDGYFSRSENLSLVNECGTGRVYAIHATGEDRLFGRGYWLLSEVVLGADGRFERRPVRAFWQDQNPGNCHLRSSATAYAANDHGLGLICHERAVHKNWFEDRDFFSFRVFEQAPGSANF